ncbi:hypothetical protein BU16DRAFT_601327 [Lophium mytilinum]|uniref:Uncharacterized protein n=1 Tax=Lophium mytilinum TaxID=390894 RepID=A0A6A6QA44_9PEZI|nr:hypothetical protein BU16DRAFT_601327 [Lophium mytilinum]
MQRDLIGARFARPLGPDARDVPRGSTLLGSAALSRKPVILQPFVVLKSAYSSGKQPNEASPRSLRNLVSSDSYTTYASGRHTPSILKLVLPLLVEQQEHCVQGTACNLCKSISTTLTWSLWTTRDTSRWSTHGFRRTPFPAGTVLSRSDGLLTTAFLSPLRHGGTSITNFELLPQPEPKRARDKSAG